MFKRETSSSQSEPSALFSMRRAVKALLSLIIMVALLKFGFADWAAMPFTSSPLQASNVDVMASFQQHINSLTRSKAPFPPQGVASVITFRFISATPVITDSEDFIPRFGVPVLNGPKLLERLLTSIDIPIGELVIVWNIIRSSKGLTWATNIQKVITDDLLRRKGSNVTIHVVEGNVGVAAAWNMMLDAASPAPFTFISSHDVAFNKGYLMEVAQHISGQPTQGFFMTGAGYCFFAIRRETIAAIGSFDENIWPAYCEDCEHINRLLLSGWSPENRLPGEIWTHFLHGLAGPSPTMREDRALSIAIREAQKLNCDYVAQKWNFTGTVHQQCGAMPGSKDHPFPFYRPYGDPQLQLSSWTFDPKRRAMLAKLFTYHVQPWHP